MTEQLCGNKYNFLLKKNAYLNGCKPTCLNRYYETDFIIKLIKAIFVLRLVPERKQMNSQ